MIEHWIYTGDSTSTTGTRIKGFTILGQPDENSYSVLYGNPTGEERFFKLTGHYTVGGVYSVEVERNDDKVTITKGSFRFIEMWHDKEAIEKWRLDHRLFEEDQRIQKFEKKHDGKYQLPTTWQDIVFTYGRFKTFTERRLFESMLLDQLRKEARNTNEQ